jgi:phosphatidylglycerophosphate synthase
MDTVAQSRRPIRVRSSNWAQNLAKYLRKHNVTANQVSIAGMIFATIGASLIISTNFVNDTFKTIFWSLAIVNILLRLLCNMLDGLIAIEGNCQSKIGIIFNEFPDRIEDSIFFIAFGFACNIQPLGTNLGWLAALLAITTAYIRSFGSALGYGQDFSGPMAKPHRMYALAIALIAVSLENVLYKSNYSPIIALFLICIGTAITCVNRTKHIISKLQGNQI